MSKVGRKPIDITDLQVDVKEKEIHYKGKKTSGLYILPAEIKAEIKEKELYLMPEENLSKKGLREVNRIWGLHRALLANELKGATKEFEKKVEIIGLGYKAVKQGDKLVFSLGYSHKIDFPLPKNVTVDIDKTGQKLLFKSSDKCLVGRVCSEIRTLRKPEPYKGTGIRVDGEIIVRKAGKTKTS